MVTLQLHVLSIHSSKFFAYYSRLLMLTRIVCVQKYRLAKYIPEISEGTFRNASHLMMQIRAVGLPQMKISFRHFDTSKVHFAHAICALTSGLGLGCEVQQSVLVNVQKQELNGGGMTVSFHL